MISLSPRPDPSALKPGDVVRLPRRIIDSVLRSGSDDRVLVREVYARAVYVQSLADPAAAWYVRRGTIASIRGVLPDLGGIVRAFRIWCTYTSEGDKTDAFEPNGPSARNRVPHLVFPAETLESR